MPIIKGSNKSTFIIKTRPPPHGDNQNFKVFFSFDSHQSHLNTHGVHATPYAIKINLSRHLKINASKFRTAAFITCK